MHAFVRVVDMGSLTSAAKELHMTSSAMSKLVARLEGRLGVRLLQRTSRRLALTSEGEVYLGRAREIIEAIHDAVGEVSSTVERPHGRLRVNCTSRLTFHHLSRVLPEFAKAIPELQLELSLAEHADDLDAEHADVGLRSGGVFAPTFVVKRIAKFQRRLYAAPRYLETHGVPLTPLQLVQNHRCVVHGSHGPIRWPFDVDGARCEFNVITNLVVDNAEAAIWLAVSGGGVTRVADSIAADFLRRGLLIPVLRDYHFNDDITFAAIYPHGLHQVPKVRAFLRYLSARFAKVDW